MIRKIKRISRTISVLIRIKVSIFIVIIIDIFIYPIFKVVSCILKLLFSIFSK